MVYLSGFFFALPIYCVKFKVTKKIIQSAEELNFQRLLWFWFKSLICEFTKFVTVAFLVLLHRSFAFDKCSTVHRVITVINIANHQCNFDKNVIDFISFETGCKGNIRKYACKQVVHISFFSSFFMDIYMYYILKWPYLYIDTFYTFFLF